MASEEFKAKKRAYHKRWRDANPDKAKADPIKKSANAKRYRAQDPEKIKAQKKAERIRNADRYRERNKRRYAENKLKFQENSLKYRFGLTLEQFDQMYANQSGCCSICGEHRKTIRDNVPKHQRLCVDHDHSNGKVRSLLCINCNSGLGLFKEDVARLIEAACYVEKHRAS